MAKPPRRIKVAITAYTAAVNALLQVAQQPTSGGAIAAQLLLSAYDGSCYHANIGAMRTLDSYNFENAVIVFTGRYDTGLEPHQVISNGSTIFETLKIQWRHLHVENRWQGKLLLPNESVQGKEGNAFD